MGKIHIPAKTNKCDKKLKKPTMRESCWYSVLIQIASTIFAL